MTAAKRLGWGALVAILCAESAIGCSHDSSKPNPAPAPPPSNDGQVVVRRTSFGIPHVTAPDMTGLAFGQGYATAQDHVCLLASEFMKLRSQRAAFLGPGDSDANVDSDFGYLAFHVHDNARAAIDKLPADIATALRAYAAGYNNFLSSTPAQNLPSDCAQAKWVKPIDEVDVMARLIDLGMANFARTIIPLAGNAQPPVASSSPMGLRWTGQHGKSTASNGWGIGGDLSASGKGMLVANPHLPWDDDLRFHEIHLTIPGQLDAYGAALVGAIGINIGFNEHVSWTHTTSNSFQETTYKLTLKDKDPTSYLFDGSYRQMTATDASIDVLQADGSTQSVTRKLYASHQGPVLNLPGVGWTSQTAFVLRSASVANASGPTELLRRMSAKSLDEFKAIDAENRATPWANTIYADDSGNAFFVDSSRVPNLTPDAAQTWLDGARGNDAMVAEFFDNGLVLLDGSTSATEWQPTPGNAADDVVAFDQAPQLQRSDFVFNANDYYWLVNPAAPLQGAPLLYGLTNRPISPRSRVNLRELTDRTPQGPSGSDGRFSFEELEAAVLSNSTIGDLLEDPIVQRCRAGVATRSGAAADALSKECDALAVWDGKVNSDSRGAVLWRELLAQYSYADLTRQGSLWAVDFDPKDPVGTPNTVTAAPSSGPDPLLANIDAAAATLAKAGIALDARLGDAQFATRQGQRFEVHGGIYADGAMNVVSHNPSASESSSVLSSNTGLVAQGYPINYGTSFLMVVEFTGSGPHAEAVLTYGESSDAQSPHAVDQLPLFAAKRWRPVLFHDADVSADPNLTVTKLTPSDKP